MGLLTSCLSLFFVLGGFVVVVVVVVLSGVQFGSPLLETGCAAAWCGPTLDGLAEIYFLFYPTSIAARMRAQFGRRRARTK